MRFVDVTCDREFTSLFHYTMQRSDGKERLTMGQEPNVSAAIDAVECSLPTQFRASA